MTQNPRPQAGRVAGAVGLSAAALSVALAAAALAPWRGIDAARPDAGDDPLGHRQIVCPVPSALEQRGLHKTDSDAGRMLSNWNYTDTSYNF